MRRGYSLLPRPRVADQVRGQPCIHVVESYFVDEGQHVLQALGVQSEHELPPLVAVFDQARQELCGEENDLRRSFCFRDCRKAPAVENARGGKHAAFALFDSVQRDFPAGIAGLVDAQGPFHDEGEKCAFRPAADEDLLVLE